LADFLNQIYNFWALGDELIRVSDEKIKGKVLCFSIMYFYHVLR